MYPNVHIYPKVSKSTCIQNYPKLSKPHVHVSKTIPATCTCKWNVNVHVSKSTCIQKYIYIQKYQKVHVSKTIQATCTCIEMYIDPIRHIKSQASSCSFPALSV